MRPPLRRNRSGIAENTLVSISSGGRSRYITGKLASKRRRTINDEGGGVSSCHQCCPSRALRSAAKRGALKICDRTFLVRRTNNGQIAFQFVRTLPFRV